MILAFPFLLVMFYLALRRDKTSVKKLIGSIAVFTLAVVSLLALVAARNYAVAGTPSVFPSSGPVTLRLGNPPPESVDLSRIGSDPLYSRLHLSDDARQVVEYARQQPGSFALGMLAKLLYTLGWYSVHDPRLGIEWSKIALWAVTIVYFTRLGVAAGAHRPDEDSGSNPTVPRASVFGSLVLLVLVLVQVITFSLISPNQAYGNRVIEPMYILLVPFAGWMVAKTFDWLKTHPFQGPDTSRKSRKDLAGTRKRKRGSAVSSRSQGAG
jgi:hypothetical protein